MPPKLSNKQGKRLAEGALTLGVRLDGTQIEAFLTYLGELKRWNHKVNLTSLKGDEEIIEKHFLDSLGGAGLIPAGGARVLDIGSGAGFPGLVFKIVRPEIALFLLEPTGKKAAFLHHVCGRLGLQNSQVIPTRLEELDRNTGPFDLCVSRALGAPGKLLEHCRSLIGKNGRVILYEGRPGNRPLPPPGKNRQGGKKAEWSREALIYRLPFSGIFREIGVYRLV